MNAIVLTGFLGTGKTTLLLAVVERLLAHGARVAIIENERGSVGVDGPFLQSHGLTVREIRAGCVCCDLAMPLRQTVEILQQRFQPEWLFLEASGVAHADKLRRGLEVDTPWIDWKFIGLVDAARFARLWNDQYGIGLLVRPQVAQADLLVLTKTDMVDEDRLLATAAEVRQLRPDVPVLPFAADDPICTTLLVRALEEYLCIPQQPPQNVSM